MQTSGISFIGLNSGFDSAAMIQQLVALKTRTDLSPTQVKIAKINERRTGLESIKSRLDSIRSKLNISALTKGTEDLVSKSITSSDTEANYLSVFAADNAVNESFNIEVTQLATSSVKRSSAYIKANDLSLSSNISDAQTLNGEAITNGQVTINGETREFNSSTGTLNDIKAFFDSFSGVTASYDEDSGKFNLSGITSIGSSGDTSSLIQALGLDRAKIEAGSLSSLQNLEAASLNTKLSELGITATELTINGSTVSANGDMSVSDLIITINNDSSQSVTASYDSISGLINLKNKDTGSLAITLSANGDISALSLNEDILGKNAEFSINGGNTLVSNSNTVTGIKEGVDFGLKKLTNEAVDLAISDDYSGYEELLNDLASDLTGLIKDLEKDKTSFGRNMINKLRNMLGGVHGNSNDQFKSLVDIGFQTNLDGNGAFQSISFDASKLTNAIESISAIDSLLFGSDGGNYDKLDSGSDGVLVQLDSLFNSYSNSSSTGILDSLLDSSQSRLRGYQKDLEKKQERIERYEISLRRQFSSLDSINAQLQQQQVAVNALQS